MLYDSSSKKLILSCDASPYDVGGLRVALSFKLDDETECPKAFASRSLSPAEKYAQLDKEGLAIVFGVRPLSSGMQIHDLLRS